MSHMWLATALIQAWVLGHRMQHYPARHALPLRRSLGRATRSMLLGIMTALVTSTPS